MSWWASRWSRQATHACLLPLLLHLTQGQRTEAKCSVPQAHSWALTMAEAADSDKLSCVCRTAPAARARSPCPGSGLYEAWR